MEFGVGNEAFDDAVGLPLRPHEVVLLPGVVVAHLPPKSLFERRPHENGVIATANIILVGREGGNRECATVVIRLVDLDQKCTVVPLLQLQVLLLVLGVDQILR